ncbi:TonB-linked SusC/RagA family outer membrane protein [Chitinophaga dinghuensis]|uniref:TonB-linked SusC/RagA family outer membrane protein n=1 Tax=Chitinophaga dinghuensis TaxID=1539050 RepID=A0A327VMK6_9BACT|nr:TonB-dependent receptor [Chitinophaga dinghuensis]RAJ75006.1 TonB-linked SusC/RagA family outer membrane protein [Chitinophaga dinghuensis]
MNLLLNDKAVSLPVPLKLLMIMKWTAVFICIAALHVSAKGYSQKVTINSSSIRLNEVFKDIRKQTGLAFVYDKALLDKTHPVTINARDREFTEVLAECLYAQHLTFEVTSNIIIIKKAPPVGNIILDNITTTVIGQGDIKGHLAGPEGEAIIGATVRLKGTEKATITNATGDFTLSGVKDGTYLLEVSSIGYENFTRSVTVKNENIHLDLKLQKSISGLNDVVVVAYSSQRKSTFTGSVSTLSTKQLEGSPRATIQDNLQGNVSGVVVSMGSGQPGAAPNVRIRGIGSINAGSSPLYVVDGIPLNSVDLNSFNANDIASMTVLKDAAAASLYGSRAANGVIIITTKKGAAGKTTFNASAQTGFTNVSNAVDDRPLNTREQLELFRESWINAGKDPALFVPELVKQGIDTTVNTNWFKELTRTGNYQQFNLSASGGTEKTTYFLSGGYYNVKSPLLGSAFKRYNFTARINAKATEKLSLQAGIITGATQSNTVSDDGSNANPVRAYKRYEPWLRVYLPDGSYDLSYSNNYNPVAFTLENKHPHDRYNLIGNLGLKYEIIRNLTFENQNSVDFEYAENLDYNKAGIGTARSNGGSADYSTARAISLVSTNLLRYMHDWGRHHLEAFGGYEAQQVRSSDIGLSKTNFIPNSFTLSNAAVLVDGTNTATGNTLTGLFSNFSYSYHSKYYLSASLRRDGSSRFGAEKRYGNFWSLGASWNIISESFMKDMPAISQLRLRASYGSNGNQSIADFASRGLYTNTASYNNNPGYYLSQYGNNNLTWEKNNPFNVGLDFGLLKDRIQGTVEYYNRVTSSLLLDMPVSATNGINNITRNVGSVRNSGIELELNTLNIVAAKRGGFSWNTRATFSTLNNKITKLVNTIVSSPYIREQGGDYYQFYMVGFAGANPDNGEALFYTDNTKSTTTNDYTKAVRYKQGSALANFVTGMTNTFEYKGFSFSFQLYGSFGSKVFDNWGTNTYTDGSATFGPTAGLPRYYYDNRWTAPGQTGKLPKVVYKGVAPSTSDRFLYDGTYIRLRDITLAYDLPASLMHRLRMSSTRIYARANNLYTYVKDKRLTFDPEVGIEGQADQSAPIYRTIMFGIDFKF